MSQQLEAAESSSSNETPPLNLKKQQQIESRTLEIGQQIFGRSQMSMFKTDFWISKVMELSTRDPHAKTQLFRYVDVLPALRTGDQQLEHLREYLAPPAKGGSSSHRKRTWPRTLRWVHRGLDVPLIRGALTKIAHAQVSRMGKSFIIGEDLDDALPKILQRRSQKKLGFTLDILGEAVFSDREAQNYTQRYSELIDRLGGMTWTSIPQLDEAATGAIPPVNISIKISALDCRMDSMAFEESLARLESRIIPLMRLAKSRGVFLNFDMEQFALKDLTRQLFKRLILRDEFKQYRHFGVVVQAYLKSSLADVSDWIKIAHQRGTPFTIRLVKGAYWDYETIVADQNGWDCPVFSEKWQSDENYEKCAAALLDAYPFIELALGSHNVRSISYAMAYAEQLKLPKNAFEVQMLYGMAEPFKKALVEMGMRLREYDPVGDLLPGLSYLVRRLLENTSNDSFLRQTFMDQTGIHDLMKMPQRR